MVKGLQLTVGNFGCLHGDEIESFLAFDVCVVCLKQLPHPEDDERRSYDNRPHCEKCYSDKLSSGILEKYLVKA